MQNRAPAWCQYGPYCKCGIPFEAINDGYNGNGGNPDSGGNKKTMGIIEDPVQTFLRNYLFNE